MRVGLSPKCDNTPPPPPPPPFTIPCTGLSVPRMECNFPLREEKGELWTSDAS